MTKPFPLYPYSHYSELELGITYYIDHVLPWLALIILIFVTILFKKYDSRNLLNVSSNKKLLSFIQKITFISLLLFIGFIIVIILTLFHAYSYYYPSALQSCAFAQCLDFYMFTILKYAVTFVCQYFIISVMKVRIIHKHPKFSKIRKTRF